MGNVYQAGGFEAVWNGRKYRALRKHLYFPECRECPNTRGKDMERLDSHLDCQFGDHAPLPLILVAVKAPASAGQVRSAVSCLKHQTYPVWEAILELDEDGDPSVLRAAQEEAQADPRVRCGSRGCGTGRELVGALSERAGATSSCCMDPARQFKSNELELQLRTFDGFGTE